MEIVEHVLHVREYKRSSRIFHEGDEREVVYFVRTGIIKVYKVDDEGREQIVSFLRAGDMFPHVGLFDETPYPGTAEAVEDSVLAYISVREFEKLLMVQPKVGVKVIRVLGSKITELQQKLHDVTLKTVSDRIVNFLTHLSKQNGEPEGDGVLLPFRFTNQDLANMVGTSRETVNRVLSDLRSGGTVDFRADGIWISHTLK